MAGLSSAGFVRSVAAEIKTDLEDRFRAVFGSAIRTDPRSVFGQLIGVLTGSFDELWQLVETIYHAFDPRVATGAALDAVSAITGTSRKPATSSTGFVTVTGTATTVVAAGSVVSNSDSTYLYATDADATAMSAATAWSAIAVVATGAYRTANSNIYYAIVGGTTGSTAPSIEDAYPETEIDGTVEWVFIGEGTAYTAAVPITASASGVVAGPAYSLSTIGTPASGWSGVANIEDVSQGRAAEPDSDLRVRRVGELHGLSRCTVESITSALTSRTDVTQAFVFENTAHETVDSMPPHSVEAVVLGAITDNDVAAVLLANVAAGIKTYGNDSGTAADSHGGSHTIGFTRPVDVDCYVILEVVANRNLWPSDGATRAEDAALAYGTANLVVGYDLESSALVGAVFTDAIPGTLSVVAKIGTAPSPTLTTPVSINQRQIAKLDSSRTTVTVTYRTP